MCPFLLIYGEGEAELICFRAGSGHESSIMVCDKVQHLWPGGMGLKRQRNSSETGAKRELPSSRTVTAPDCSQRTDTVEKNVNL